MRPIDETAIRDWFDRHYRHRGLKSMRAARAYPVYLDLLHAQPGGRLLDIGCGPGWLLRAAAGRGLEAWGIDLSARALQMARQVVPEARLSAGSAAHLAFPNNYFDYLTCIGVLEHFTHMEQSVREMQRVARYGARFCIMVPNSITLHWWISERFGRWNRGSNENAASLEEWQNLFTGFGFRIEAVLRDTWQVRKGFGFLGESAVRQVTRLAERLVPLRFAHQFIFILTLVAEDD